MPQRGMTSTYVVGTDDLLRHGGTGPLSVPADRNDQAAKRLHEEVQSGVHGAIVTTSFVLDEATTLVHSLTDVVNAVRFVRTALRDASVTVV
jgi:hypothetical protein